MLQSIFILFVVFFSMSIHELFHGLLAFKLGDPTAKIEGRLTLNPLKHIDPFGTIFLPLFLWVLTFGEGPIFGFAKPVPVNPLLLKDQKWGMLKVALAGPLSNLIVGISFAFFARFLPQNSTLFSLFYLISIYNFIFAFFNLFPVYPLDGFYIFSKLLPERFYKIKIFLAQYGILLLLLILVFGLNIVYFFSEFLFSLISGT